MPVIKSFISALSTYSKIPMPNISYKEGEGRFTLCFFPVVGIVIWCLQYIAALFTSHFGLTSEVTAILFMLIPVAVTGGIHLDGFMDSMDAINSYRDKDYKLNILKDPHIGAFCVIKLLELVGVWLACLLICLSSNEIFYIELLAIGFIFSRNLSALSIAIFPLAKNEGMVAYTVNHKSTFCHYILVVEFFVVTVISLFYFGVFMLAPILSSVLAFGYYRYRVVKDFGGITGDTSGCFLVMVETAWIVVISILVIGAFI